MKLRSLQKGTFDSKYGEYEWVHKVNSFAAVCIKSSDFARRVVLS